MSITLDDTEAARAGTLNRFREYRRTGSTELRDRLTEEHVGFADYLARRFAHRGEPLDDLRQVAMVGLLKAIERFDPELGNTFTTFAAPTIVGELKRHFRDRTWAVRVPRQLQELSLEIERARTELGHELGRPPRLDEIAAFLDATEEEVLEGMDAASVYRLRSLDAPTDDEFGRSERVGGEDAELTSADDRLMIRELIADLPEREREIVYLRYFEGLTQTEIAERVGISQMHVSRLLSRSLETLGRVVEEGESR